MLKTKLGWHYVNFKMYLLLEFSIINWISRIGYFKQGTTEDQNTSGSVISEDKGEELW